MNDNSCRAHHHNLQKLLRDMFKVKSGLVSAVVRNVFQIVDIPYSLRSNTTIFKSRNVQTVRYRIETASFAGPKI